MQRPLPQLPSPKLVPKCMEAVSLPKHSLLGYVTSLEKNAILTVGSLTTNVCPGEPTLKS